MAEDILTIMIVDDDGDDIELFVEAVGQISDSIKCIAIHSCKEALALLSRMSTPPDLIFLDVNIPVYDGRWGLTQIRKLEKLKHTPVVMHSTSISERDKEFFVQASARVLLKENDFLKLVAGLRDIIIHEQTAAITRELTFARSRVNEIFEQLEAEVMEAFMVSDVELRDKRGKIVRQKLALVLKSLDSLSANSRLLVGK